MNPPDTHGEAPALVGARKETRGVRVHLLVLEAGRGAVRSFATQGCPEIVWNTQTEADASPVHGTHTRVTVWAGLGAFLWVRKSQRLQTYMRALLNNENTPEKTLLPMSTSSCSGRQIIHEIIAEDVQLHRNYCRLHCDPLTWLFALSNLHWASSQYLQQLLCS